MAEPVLVARMIDTIDADPEAVFATVAHGGRHGEAIPEVESVDFVSDETMGVGAQFRENRDWTAVQVLFAKFARLHRNVIECIEYEPHRRVRYMSNGAGARWHSIYTLVPVDEGRTRLELRLEIRPKNPLGRWLPQLMKAPLQASTEADFKAIKRHIEDGAS
ncbi:SRPBCC family protein [Candidatus Palauibacter polyketidifaciens]|uniref:SRPBCC family protein n=1 Tax=Candidatus Palauibacter polyketidifaciens TaxID=3056740 RepID=UPI0023A5B65D|nr:SRPBCC family protein [Candidatus Palauibacter polyketidifaciens]MDE2721607.1 SRPBCC family protein [Candidatus Palauibacter polyketidifaciens]